ncbi:histidine kinase dimerization/phosphoacceptor domain -containing protein [uncultured Paracoccus sp.]|uniref:sensor histidine kinase n=1 Tax=uncultured Paracoccus sp. TaxID=189685 RepID=UPI0026278E06|nr:histidine kinase dimerization/phosphoacceptor domain -containing protein [uncultured Paracoccus sp.]
MRGLGFRLAMLLSVAILPIGLISLMQTLNLSQAAERSAELALLGRTSAAAAGERALLQNALGSADALGPAVLETMKDSAACSDMLRRFVQNSASFTFAGFTRLDGFADCTSRDDGRHDLRGSEHYLAFIENPGVVISAASAGPITGEPVVIVSQALYEDSELLGYVATSMSQDLMRSTHDPNNNGNAARVVTFTNTGQVLSTDASRADVSTLLPQGATLQSLIDRSETTFREVANSGETRLFTVVPVIPGLVYALGSWNLNSADVINISISRFTGILFPVALWAVSLAVAYFAVFRLVLRHIRELRGQMRRFAIGDRRLPPPVLEDAPAEIADVSQTFHDMARILIRDEAAMEAAVHEKTVLLKEVHHRVKNNLQLIASIINMQSRMFRDSEAGKVLRSVQDRVASLATIYRNLYQAEHLDSVEADRLISDIINQMANASVGPGSGLTIQTDLDHLTLLPDQAVPLTLLTTEAFTNALKYAGRSEEDGRYFVRVALKRDVSGFALLEVENSIGPSTREQIEGTGLGGQLIEAFATQLDSEAETHIDEKSYRLRMRFRVDENVGFSVEPERRVVLTSAARGGARH